MKRLSLAILACVLGLVGCRVDVDTIPAGVKYLCTGAASDECPEGWSCDTSTTLDGGGHLCVAPNGKAGLPGSACTAASDCQSGFCVDGVCCDTQCDGLCMACNVEGKKGTCSPVPAGTDPADECAPAHPDICAATCDGAGACAAPALGSTCGTCRACVLGSVGSSGALGQICGPDCGSYQCEQSGQCKTSCASNTDCIDGSACVAGKCQSKFSNGAACQSDGTCLSGHCILGADGGAGVCCNEDCKVNTGPCGNTGACDLTDGGANFGHCEVAPADAGCAASSCSNGQFIPEQHCPGGGLACPVGTPQPCPGGAACANSQLCEGSCVPGTQNGCSGSGWCHAAPDGGTYCVAGAQQNGEACGANTDCSSSHCDHQLCCTSGTCCDGTTSTCANRSPECQVATCSGTTYGYTCSADFSCVENANNDASACSGQVVSSCGTFRDAVCGSTGTTCPTTCLNASSQPDDSLCDPGTFCNANGKCYAPLPDGNGLPDGGTVACNRGVECESGFCDASNLRPDFSYPPHLCCHDSGTHQCCSTIGNCGDGVGNGSNTGGYTVCTQPSRCQGTRTAASCTNFACVANGAVTDDDSKCWYQLDPNDVYDCGNNLGVRCNGSSYQDLAASCPPSCGAVCGFGGLCSCGGNNNSCLPGTTCHNASGSYPSCSGSCY